MMKTPLLKKGRDSSFLGLMVILSLTSNLLSAKIPPMHHAMNHVGFMISPELNVVQGRVHGPAS